MNKNRHIHIAVRTLIFKVRRGPAGQGKSGFAFADRSKYNRKRNKETRDRF
jgi:hypothetical protein